MTVAGQSAVTYTYDNADRLTGITQGSSTVTLAYDNANRRTTLTLPNTVQVAYNYDNASQLTGLTYTVGTTTLGNLTYDSAGRRTSVGGNFARTGLPLAVSSTTYDAANELTKWGTASPTYDSNGNLTNDGVNTYTWDARNHLKSITSGSTTVGSFVYDALGRRMSKTVAGVTKELYMFALVYNLVRLVMLRAAHQQRVSVDRVSFVDALRWLRQARPDTPLPPLVLNPPRRYRFEPRVRKRRPKHYPLMTKPRAQLRKTLERKQVAA